MFRTGKTLFGAQFPRNSPLPTWIAYFIFLCLGITFLLSFLAVNDLPDNVAPDHFIAQNAYSTVNYLAENIGPRIAGTVASEVRTVGFLLDQISSMSVSPDLEIDVRHEVVNGTMPKRYRFVNIYRGIQNIVVKLSPRNVNPRLKYILMNSHYDSVPTSPGAGDDGSMVGVMLELLRFFAQKKRIDRPLVFLFNGAEEYILAGTDGFIHSNEWMPNIGMLINLEAGGTGGRELLFQVRDVHPWIMTAYKNVPHPFAATIAEEVWNSGLIPSDTDFSNFKLFLDRLPAMDMAYIGDGYAYHTRLDDMSRISVGSLQHTGDNLVKILYELDGKAELDDYLVRPWMFQPVYKT